jgi:predicted RNase H-like nuclease (RuvC/YqgF family)
MDTDIKGACIENLKQEIRNMNNRIETLEKRLSEEIWKNRILNDDVANLNTVWDLIGKVIKLT